MTCNQTIQSGSNIPVLNTVQALRTFNNYQDEMTVIVLGNLSYSDGNGGIYTFDSTSTLADDGINTIQPTSIASGTPGRYILTNLNSTADGLVTALKAQYASASGASLIGYQYDSSTKVRTVQNRLTDSVSVKDFGAVGDGVTDDTMAFNNAVNAGIKNLEVPQGTYSITNQFLLMQSDCLFHGPGNFLIHSYTIPCGDILIGQVTLPVPQIFPEPNSALGYLNNRKIGDGSTAIIKISDGTYEFSNIVPTHPDGNKINIIGNITNPSNVVCKVNQTNFGSFLSLWHTKLGRIDGLNIIGQQWISKGVWDTAASPYGCAILAGVGSSITIGGHMIIDKCYYGVRAENGGQVYIEPGTSVSNAGDVGYHAWNGGNIFCNTTSATDCAHTSEGLGDGYLAETGGHIACEASTATGNGLAGFASYSGSSMWAMGCHSSGNTYGFLSSNGAHLIAVSSNTVTTTSNNNTYGMVAKINGSIEAGNSQVTNNIFDGLSANGCSTIWADGATITGNGGAGVIARNNGIIGSGYTSSNNKVPDTANSGGIINANLDI